MRSKLKRGLVPALLILFALAGRAFAGELQPKLIDPHAKWYLHVNFEKLRTSEAFKGVLDLARAQWPVDDILAQVKDLSGINPLTDIQGATAYNTTFDKGVAVLLIDVKADPSIIVPLLQNNPNYAKDSHGEHILHTWVDNDRNQVMCIYDDKLVVMSDTIQRVSDALDVLDKKDNPPAAIAANAPAGEILTAGAELASLPDQLVANAMSPGHPARLAIGEHDGILKADLVITAASDHAAANLRQIATGAIAMGSLAMEKLPSVQKLIGQLDIKANAAELHLSFSQDAKALVKMYPDIVQDVRDAFAAPPRRPGGL